MNTYSSIVSATFGNLNVSAVDGITPHLHHKPRRDCAFSANRLPIYDGTTYSIVCVCPLMNLI